MSEEELEKICSYIKNHAPKETDFDTIDAAIRAIMGYSAAKRRDVVGPDDAWLIPDEEKDQFAGMKGNGWIQQFIPRAIKKIEEAVLYANEHRDEYINSQDISEELENLKKLRNDIVNNSEIDNTDYKDKDYSDTNNIRNFGK